MKQSIRYHFIIWNIVVVGLLMGVALIFGGPDCALAALGASAVGMTISYLVVWMEDMYKARIEKKSTGTNPVGGINDTKDPQ